MLQYAPFPRVGEFNKDNDKEKELTMIAVTSKNGKSVRLDADFQIDVEKAYYTVHCDGCTFEFGEFAPAAKVYKTLSARIEANYTILDCLRKLVEAARAMGFTVRKAVA